VDVPTSTVFSLPVIPAKAGIQKRLPPREKWFYKGPEGPFWIPACAGMTKKSLWIVW